MRLEVAGALKEGVSEAHGLEVAEVKGEGVAQSPSAAMPVRCEPGKKPVVPAPGQAVGAEDSAGQ